MAERRGRRRRHLRRAALDRAVPGERARRPDGRRRQRLERRHGRVRARALSGGDGDRVGEPRPRRRLEHAGSEPTDSPLRAPAERRRLARRRRARRASSTFADSRPRAAVVGPRLSNPDGTLQRSVRGFPTLWRLATEYFFLRKLAPRSSALNAFYAGGFDHDEVREVEFVMGACMLRAPGGGRPRSGSPTRTSSSSARRPTGATASGRPGGRSCSSRAPSACTCAAPRTRAASTARTCAGTCASSRKHRGRRPAERARRLLRVARSCCAACSSAASAEARTATPRAWLGSGRRRAAARGQVSNIGLYAAARACDGARARAGLGARAGARGAHASRRRSPGRSRCSSARSPSRSCSGRL